MVSGLGFGAWGFGREKGMRAMACCIGVKCCAVRIHVLSMWWGKRRDETKRPTRML